MREIRLLNGLFFNNVLLISSIEPLENYTDYEKARQIVVKAKNNLSKALKAPERKTNQGLFSLLEKVVERRTGGFPVVIKGFIKINRKGEIEFDDERPYLLRAEDDVFNTGYFYMQCTKTKRVVIKKRLFNKIELTGSAIFPFYARNGELYVDYTKM